jgi:hypothetical protein
LSTTNPKRPRGRPLSPETIEARRVKNMLVNLPPHIPRMSVEEQAEFEKWDANLEEIRKQILATYRHGNSTPTTHAYNMASLGDESLHGHESNILKEDEEYKKRADRYREKGTNEAVRSAQLRVTKVAKHFESLLARTKPLGPLTHAEAARRMLRSWPKEFGEAPSERTLRRQIKLIKMM